MLRQKRHAQIRLDRLENCLFDLQMDFVGDFSVLPTRIDLHGTYSKKKFIARYYPGSGPFCLCQQTQREVDSAKTELRRRLAK